jgi:UDP-glucose 4-epimerase
MDKVVVVGGSGFMGSYVADELTRRRFKVVNFDNTPSLWRQSGQDEIVGDIRDEEQLLRAFDGARYVYHFAGIADISAAREDPRKAIESNVMGAVNAVEACIESGVERFLYASTMYVYSDRGSFYRATKQAAETLIESYYEHSGIKYTFLRYGSLYGPRSQEWNGMRMYIKQVVEQGRVSYSGSGREKREYIHVRDAARLSVDVLERREESHAVIITGSQALYSEELLKMIFEIAGVKEDVAFSSSDKQDFHYGLTPYRYTPKVASKLTPAEFVDIGQGILELVEEAFREKTCPDAK